MYKRILAALDGSPRTELVFSHAEQLARMHGAILHLCRAVNVPVGVPLEAWALSGGELTEKLLEDGQSDLAALRGRLSPPIVGENRVQIGRPAQVICELADELEVDLIVIGSHGFDALDRLIGTTAARVVNHAHCSVMVVRPPRSA
ncbi:universal stress protein [Nannocystis punicea]|uniref:Universal stress protein n=1 Tax=Nannocystis punicea TaxID=2995304 RepID=A0ABY7GRV3_9BACT|nr:universal stress protein [Nannocystis poenicansa]WAS89696.1 universal stress protein [Nannocystis poenicansa]